jgi:phage-related minor tail protein
MLAAGSTEEAFGLMMKAIEDLKDPQRRAALASAAFGDSGKALVLMAEAGGDEINNLRKAFVGLHGEIDDNATKSAEDFQDALTDLKAAGEGVRNAIGAQLLPVLQEQIQKLTGWITKNRESIGAWARDFAEKLPSRIAAAREAFAKLWSGVKPVVDFIGRLVKRLGPANTALLAIAGIIAKAVLPIVSSLASVLLVTGKIIGAVLIKIAIPALALLAKAFIGVGIAIMTTPVGWILGAIALIAGGVYLLIRNWDTVAGFFRGVWAKVVAHFSEAWSKLAGFFRDLWGGVSSIFSSVWEGLSDKATEWATAFVDKFKAPIQGMVEWVQRQVSRVKGLVPSWMQRGEMASAIAQPGQADNAGPALAAPPILAASDPAKLLGGMTSNRETNDAHVRVSFDNLPRGARVRDEGGDAPLEMDLGYAMAGAG